MTIVRAICFALGVALFAAGTFLLVACGTVDGSDPYALWRTYEHPDESFHFHYPSPPWKHADDSTAKTPVLVISPESDVVVEGPGSRLRLEARTIADLTFDEAVLNEKYAWRAWNYSTTTEKFESGGGDLGVLITAWTAEHWVSQVLYEQGNSVVTLFVWGRGDIPEPDLDLLLVGFEPRGA